MDQTAYSCILQLPRRVSPSTEKGTVQPSTDNSTSFSWKYFVSQMLDISLGDLHETLCTWQNRCRAIRFRIKQYFNSYLIILVTSSERCHEPINCSKRCTVTFREKRTATFRTLSGILQAVVVRIVSTICFPLPLPFRCPVLETSSSEKLKRGHGLSLLLVPCRGCKRHKWPWYELLAQRFPAGSYMHTHMYG